jgi:Lar family restriction alleviation protein
MIEYEARRQLDSRLEVVGLARKVTYTSGEVKTILALTRSTFDRMVHHYFEDPVTKEVKEPRSIKSAKINNVRVVSYSELVAFIARGVSADRLMDAPLKDSQTADFGDLQRAGLPCPHCGCRDISPVQNHEGSRAAFRCRDCGSTGPIEANWLDALAGWNRRMG